MVLSFDDEVIVLDHVVALGTHEVKLAAIKGRVVRVPPGSALGPGLRRAHPFSAITRAYEGEHIKYLISTIAPRNSNFKCKFEKELF